MALLSMALHIFYPLFCYRLVCRMITGFTRAILALALQAHFVRTKRLPAVLSNRTPFLIRLGTIIKNHLSSYLSGFPRALPGPCLAGALCACKTASCRFVEPYTFSHPVGDDNKKPPIGGFLLSSPTGFEPVLF